MCESELYIEIYTVNLSYILRFMHKKVDNSFETALANAGLIISSASMNECIVKPT